MHFIVHDIILLTAEMTKRILEKLLVKTMSSVFITEMSKLDGQVGFRSLNTAELLCVNTQRHVLALSAVAYHRKAIVNVYV